MKWIKASERLPENLKPVKIKVDGEEKYSKWVEYEKAFMINGYRYPPRLYYIEWLDESPSPSLSAEQEAKEYAERVFVEVFNIDTTKESVIKAIASAYLAGKESGGDGWTKNIEPLFRAYIEKKFIEFDIRRDSKFNALIESMTHDQLVSLFKRLSE